MSKNPWWLMMMMLVLMMMMVIVMVMMMVTPYRQNFGTNLFARASLKLWYTVGEEAMHGREEAEVHLKLQGSLWSWTGVTDACHHCNRAPFIVSPGWVSSSWSSSLSPSSWLLLIPTESQFTVSSGALWSPFNLCLKFTLKPSPIQSHRCTVWEAQLI